MGASRSFPATVAAVFLFCALRKRSFDWQTAYGPTNSSLYASKMEFDPAGNLYVAGTVSSNRAQCLLLKYSPRGEMLAAIR